MFTAKKMMIKFGFGAVPTGPMSESIRLAQLGESLGYDMVWIPDQTFFRDPFVVLTMIAQATTSIRLMLGVTNPYTRHPALIARAAASVDEVSNARLVLGYGAGNRKELLLPLGLEQTSAGTRCREAVVVTKRLLMGETVRHRSDTLICEDVQLLLPPRPNLPVYLAGRGPVILRAAGTVADGAIIGGLVSPAGLQYGLDQVEAGLNSRQSLPGHFEIISWVSCHLTDDRASAIETLKPNVAHIIGGAPSEVLMAIGLEQARINQLKQAYARGGPSGAAPMVTAAEVDLLTIVGDAEYCSARIRSLAEAGAHQVGMLLTQATADEREDFLNLFAQEVMPNFA